MKNASFRGSVVTESIRHSYTGAHSRTHTIHSRALDMHIHRRSRSRDAHHKMRITRTPNDSELMFVLVFNVQYFVCVQNLCIYQLWDSRNIDARLHKYTQTHTYTREFEFSIGRKIFVLDSRNPSFGARLPWSVVGFGLSRNTSNH